MGRKGGKDGLGPAKAERDEKEKMGEKRRRLKAGGVRQRAGQGCGWQGQRRAENQREGNSNGPKTMSVDSFEPDLVSKLRSSCI